MVCLGTCGPWARWGGGCRDSSKTQRTKSNSKTSCKSSKTNLTSYSEDMEFWWSLDSLLVQHRLPVQDAGVVSSTYFRNSVRTVTQRCHAGGEPMSLFQKSKVFKSAQHIARYSALRYSCAACTGSPPDPLEISDDGNPAMTQVTHHTRHDKLKPNVN